MKVFTIFRSKLLLQNLGPFSPPRVLPVLHVSGRHEFCFTTRNENKAPNFCFLKLFQNKGIYPVLAVPSENQQVDLELEPVEPQDQQSEQINDSKFVRVAFQLQKDCDFGEQFLIVGDVPMLGLWNPLDALPMTWSDGHIWTVELDMPAGKSIQYKFILKGKGGVITWQPGPDRIIDTWETMNKIIIFEDWENVELQKIIEEDKLPQPNEELQLISEVLTSAEILENPQDELESNISLIEDTQIHAAEKPIDEPVLPQSTGDSIFSSMEKPMAIIANNIGSSDSENLMESTSYKKNIRNAIQQSEESTDGPRNEDTIMHDLAYNRNVAAPLTNQEGNIAKSNLFDFEGTPVLVPGLTPQTEEEALPGEIEEKTSIEPSIEAFETQDWSIHENTATDSSVEAFETEEHNIPETENVQLSKEQESTEGMPNEISAIINGQSELLDIEHEEQYHLAPTKERKEEEDGSDSEPPQEINAIIIGQSEMRENEHDEQFHLAPTMEDDSSNLDEQFHLAPTMEEDGSNPGPIYGNALQNDIQWGRETVKKFLTKLGLL